MAVIEEIIEAIAAAENTDPTDLDVALQNWVDTDAIRQLEEHSSDEWTLQFETPDHSVTVTGRDEVYVDGAKARSFRKRRPSM